MLFLAGERSDFIASERKEKRLAEETLREPAQKSTKYAPRKATSSSICMTTGLCFCFVLLEHNVTGAEGGEVRLSLLPTNRAVRNVGVEVVLAEAEVLDVSKVREGGRDLPSEVVLIEVERS